MSNWKETADLFSKIITYPELSEKLLKRPPFKYILSIYTSVMQKTNFMKNDFEEKELKIDYYETPKLKSVFLKKVINGVSKTLGKDITVDIKNILKGQECEQTNVFLQDLYYASTNNNNTNNTVPEPKAKKEETYSKKIESEIKSEEKKVKKNKLETKNSINENKEKSYNDELIIEAKEIIQKITQNSNPLGKIIEFIEDDIDNMNKENDKWAKEYRFYKKKMEDLEQETEIEHQNLYDKLNEINEQIDTKRSKIYGIKSQIFRNDEYIKNILTKIIDN